MQNMEILIFEVHNEDNSISYMEHNIENLISDNFQILHDGK